MLYYINVVVCDVTLSNVALFDVALFYVLLFHIALVAVALVVIAKVFVALFIERVIVALTFVRITVIVHQSSCPLRKSAIMKGKITNSLKPPLTNRLCEVGYWEQNEIPESGGCLTQKDLQTFSGES